jgi:hypothetical protein
MEICIISEIRVMFFNTSLAELLPFVSASAWFGVGPSRLVCRGGLTNCRFSTGNKKNQSNSAILLIVRSYTKNAFVSFEWWQLKLQEHFYILSNCNISIKKGSTVHVASACAEFRKGPTTLGLMYVVFSYISVRGCFKDLTNDLMVTMQLLYRCARALPFNMYHLYCARFLYVS